MLRQHDPCGWCGKTDELEIMIQGGPVHTVCAECGSNGPVVEMAAVRAALAKAKQDRADMAATLTAAQAAGTAAVERRRELEAELASIKSNARKCSDCEHYDDGGLFWPSRCLLVDRLKAALKQAEPERAGDAT